VRKTNEMLSKNMRDGMMTLLEMGFNDFKKNEEAMEKMKGNLEYVVNYLASH
jgi:hypothetical protein